MKSGSGAQQASVTESRSAPAFRSACTKENRDAHRRTVASGNGFFSLLPLCQDSCRYLKGIVTASVCHDESLTSNNFTLFITKTEVNRLKTQRANHSLTEYYYREPRECTNLLSQLEITAAGQVNYSSSTGRMCGTECQHR